MGIVTRSVAGGPGRQVELPCSSHLHSSQHCVDSAFLVFLQPDKGLSLHYGLRKVRGEAGWWCLEPGAIQFCWSHPVALGSRNSSELTHHLEWQSVPERLLRVWLVEGVDSWYRSPWEVLGRSLEGWEHVSTQESLSCHKFQSHLRPVWRRESVCKAAVLAGCHWHLWRRDIRLRWPITETKH